MALWRKSKSREVEEISGDGMETQGAPLGTLTVSIKSENGMIPMPLNSESPTPFETDVSDPSLSSSVSSLSRLLKVMPC